MVVAEDSVVADSIRLLDVEDDTDLLVVVLLLDVEDDTGLLAAVCSVFPPHPLNTHKHINMQIMLFIFISSLPPYFVVFYNAKKKIAQITIMAIINQIIDIAHEQLIILEDKSFCPANGVIETSRPSIIPIIGEKIHMKYKINLT